MTEASPAVEPVNKPHRSPSAAMKFFACGESWRRYYLEKERPPPVLAMLKGTGQHKGAQHNFTHKLTAHEDLPVTDIIDAAVAGFDEELTKSDVLLSKDEEALGKEVAIGLARDDVRNLAAAFAITQAPHYQPLEVERKFRIPVPRASHDIVGVIDLIAEIDGQPGRRLRDFKNGKRKRSAVSAADSLQLTTYAAGHWFEFGEPPVDVGLDVLIIKKGGVERQELADTRDQKDFEVLANKLNAMDAAIKAGVFLPAAEGSWQCSDKFCFFHKTCPYVNAQRIAAAADAD